MTSMAAAVAEVAVPPPVGLVHRASWAIFPVTRTSLQHSNDGIVVNISLLPSKSDASGTGPIVAVSVRRKLAFEAGAAIVAGATTWAGITTVVGERTRVPRLRIGIRFRFRIGLHRGHHGRENHDKSRQNEDALVHFSDMLLEGKKERIKINEVPFCVSVWLVVGVIFAIAARLRKFIR